MLVGVGSIFGFVRNLLRRFRLVWKTLSFVRRSKLVVGLFLAVESYHREMLVGEGWRGGFRDRNWTALSHKGKIKDKTRNTITKVGITKEQASA
jgi:hypothetical protein